VNWPLFQNSLLVSGGAAIGASLLGFVVALWTTGLAWRRQHTILLFAIVVLALPPFLVTNCWLHYLGNAGVWHRWVPWRIYSLPGAAWILTLMLWPIPFLAAWTSWRRLQAAHLESDLSLRGVSLLRWLLWPMARPSLGFAFGLVFILALNNFSVPSILQVKVYAAELWIRFSTTFDYASVLYFSIPLVIAPAVLLFLWRRRPVAWPTGESSVSGRLFRCQLGGGAFALLGLTSIVLLITSLGIPAFQLLASSRTWAELPTVFRAEPRLVVQSFLFASISAILCLVISCAGWRKAWGFLLWLPFFIPGVLLGIALIFVLNRPVLDAIYHSVGLIVFSWVVRFCGISWNGMARAFSSVDVDLVDAARTSGAKGWNLFRLAYLPQALAPLAGLGYIIYLLCLWDVETIVLTCPPGGETLALRIFNMLHYGHTAQVNALCLLLLMIAALPMILWSLGRRFRPALGLSAAGLAFFLTGCGPEDSFQSRFFSGIQTIGTRGTKLGEFNKPRSLAVDRNDNLYVVDMTGRVQKFSPEGSFLLSWQMPQTDLGKPKGMGCDVSGNILVLEPHYQRVNHFSPQGVLVAQWGRKGTNEGSLTLPRSIVVNSAGNILVSEYTTVDRVQCFAPDGKTWLFSFGRPGSGPGEFNRAEGLGLDSSNRIYVADSCNHRIQVFSPEGKFLRAYGTPGTELGQLSYPYDIRIDSEGFQYVCEFGNSRIQIFDSRDRPVEILGGIGSAVGKLNNPWAIALDAKGNLYVADANNHRVQKFIRKNATVASAMPLQVAHK
jgi:ABC-type Fe3+ transport system permease subunit/DNA-binding beta-propeller fold protein YncE